MANVLFNLKPAAGAEKHIILIFWYAPKTRFVYYTGEKINPKHWNKNKSIAKPSYEGSYKLLNQYLNTLRQHCLDIRRTMLISNKLITPAEFKIQLTNKLGITSPKTRYSEFIEAEYQKLKKTKNEDIIKGYKSRCAILEEYYPGIYIEDIGRKHFETIEEKQYEKKNSANYVAKIFTNIISELKKAEAKGITINPEIRHIKKPQPKPKAQIFCTEKELHQLYTHDYGKLTGVQNAAFCLLVSAYTSLRISDTKRLIDSPDLYRFTDKDGTVMIRIYANKTKKELVIPQHHIVADILDNNRATTIADSKMNIHIKAAGKLIGMDQPYTRLEDEGGRLIEHTHPRYKLITTHTGRRSCLTNMYLSGMRLDEIRRISGHSTEEQLLNYIKLSNIDNARTVSKQKFFKNE